ncbi:MAG: vitamin K epoxide reductase family protein [Candidatus Micrarchaeia archaeon]
MNLKRVNKVKVDKVNIFYFLLVIAIILAIYLTFVHYNSSILLCPDTGIINCNSVITSKFSTILGVPISLLAVIFFLFAFPIIKRNNEILIFIWAVIGISAILYSLSGMFILGEICIYCSLLDIIILSLVFLIMQIRNQNLEIVKEKR